MDCTSELIYCDKSIVFLAEEQILDYHPFITLQ